MTVRGRRRHGGWIAEIDVSMRERVYRIYNKINLSFITLLVTLDFELA
jgi:hypothetical protein